MIENEDAKIRLSQQGEAALAELCAMGCERSVLCGLVSLLTTPSVVTLDERVVPEFRRRSGSGLETSGGFGPPPIEAGRAQAALVALSTEATAEFPSDTRGTCLEPAFKSRELEILATQVKRASDEVRQLMKGSLARRLVFQERSPVLAMTLYARLAKYAETVIPRLLEKRLRPQNDTTVGKVNIRTPQAGIIPAPTEQTEVGVPPQKVEQLVQRPQEESPSRCADAAVSVDNVTVSGPSEGSNVTASASDCEAETMSAGQGGRIGRRLHIHWRPLDSVGEALGEYEVRDLKPLQRKFVKLAHRLEHLHRTKAGEVVAEDYPAFLSLPSELEIFATRTIVAMREVRVGPKRRPSTTRLLWRIFTYVHDRTGTYHDRLVAQILWDAGFQLGPSDEEIDEVALRKWRFQHPKNLEPVTKP